MPFLSSEKARIRVLLGWGARFWQLQTRLEAAMTAVETVLPDETALIQGYLVSLTDIDTKITSALETVGVTKVDTIGLDSDQGIMHLKNEGARLVEAIAHVLQVEIKKNYYRAGGMRGGYMSFG
jgi:low affinity Fe/Cu permease